MIDAKSGIEWRRPFTLQVSARWTDEPGNDVWELNVFHISMPDETVSLLVDARSVVYADHYEVKVRNVLPSQAMPKDALKILGKEVITRSVQQMREALWDRAMLGSAAVAGAAGAALETRQPPHASPITLGEGLE